MADADQAPATLQVQVDRTILSRAAAFAALKGTTVEAMLADYLLVAAEDVLSVALPGDAADPFLRMLRHGGRDTTVLYLGAGWAGFEPPMPAYLYAWVRATPGVMVDGGANTGFYSLLAALADRANLVLAFEPNPAVLAALRQNVVANGLDGRVIPRAEALSAGAGRADLRLPSAEHGVIETSASLESGFKSSLSQVLEVATVSIDAALAAPELAGRRVSLIKMDVSGHEASVLQGAERTVAGHRPVLFAEVLDFADFGPLSAFLARHNYLDVPLRPRGTMTAQTAVVFEPNAWNHAFVPAEALHRFLAVSSAAP
ncbi:MAG: hypothetical protein NVSMB18_15630 [Acetobacteraceae bacterium]